MCQIDCMVGQEPLIEHKFEGDGDSCQSNSTEGLMFPEYEPYGVCGFPPCSHVKQIVPASFVDQMTQLVKALEAGGYNAAPGELSQSSWLLVEDLSPTMECVTFENGRINLDQVPKFYSGVKRVVLIKCECGAEKCGSDIHSDWCAKHG